MKFLNLKKLLLVYSILFFLFGGVIGFVGGYNRFPMDLMSRIFASYILAFFVTSIPLLILWWKQTDEAVREAHKTAWFWGGGIGVILAIVFGLLDAVFNGAIARKIATLIFGQCGYGDYGVEFGIYIAVLFASIGYTINWALWWRKMGA